MHSEEFETATPSLAERAVFMAWAKGDRTEVDRALLVVAADVLASISGWGRVDCPPPPFPLYDAHPGDEGLGAYMETVTRIEAMNASRLKVLLCHGRRMQNAGYTIEAEGYRSFICNQWRVDLSDLPEINSADFVAQELSRRYDRIPRGLRDWGSRS